MNTEILKVLRGIQAKMIDGKPMTWGDLQAVSALIKKMEKAAR